MKSARMDIRAAGATPAFIRIGRALGVCVDKDEGRYGITRPHVEGGQLRRQVGIRLHREHYTRAGDSIALKETK
jgi:hypothetical protein